MAPVAEELAAVMPAFGCGVPSTVAGVDVLGVGVGVTVPDVVEGVLVVEPVVVGVTVRGDQGRRRGHGRLKPKTNRRPRR